MMFHVTLSLEEDGWIVAECPALPGCVSQGATEEDAIRNIREAITAWAHDQNTARNTPNAPARGSDDRLALALNR